MVQRENNYAFIDSQNLIMAIRKQGWNLDYQRFYQYVCDRFFVTKVFLFLGYLREKEGVYAELRSYGYILVFKPTLRLPNGTVKGNVDAELVLHIMIEYPQFDKAVIVTGDGDFYCLIAYLVAQKKLSRLVIPNKFRYSSWLRHYTNNITFLNNTKEKLEIKKEA